jgi:hypothetical protein
MCEKYYSVTIVAENMYFFIVSQGGNIVLVFSGILTTNLKGIIMVLLYFRERCSIFKVENGCRKKLWMGNLTSKI